MSSATTKLLKILIIEDDPVSRALLEKLLPQSSPFISEVKSAETFEVALELLDKNDFDVVLLDLNLPDSSSLNTLVRIIEKHQKVAIVVIISESREELGLKAITTGAQEYLIKGRYNLETLNKSIRYATERKRTQEILDIKQRNLEAIFDAAPVGMLLVNENITVIRANDAITRMICKNYSQIINQNVCSVLGCINNTYVDEKLDLSPLCKKCLIRNTIVNVLDSGQPVHRVEARLTLEISDEEITRWLSISGGPVMIDGSKQMVIALDDISERKKAEEKLLETTKMKSQFISTVSHELRTPLAAMKEAIAIVLEGVTGKINEQQKKFLAISKRNVDRLSDLITDILDFQKLEAGRMALDIQNNDIKEVVTEVHETIALSTKKEGVELLCEFAGDLPKAKFDRSKIIQVLTNLVSNAIKFTPEKGRVSVSVRQQNDELIISVSDTGIGIPKEELLKIFERFYRVSMPNEQIQGTGLGLAIVKKIVMMHGGRIEVESEIDQGTTFTVCLPLDNKPLPEVLPEEKDKHLENTLV